MSNYKDTYELYQSTFDEVHASDELIQRIKNRDTKHIKKKRFKPISTVAACLAAVMIITVIIGTYSGKGNSFVLKANAAEIGGESFVEIAKVAPVSVEVLLREIREHKSITVLFHLRLCVMEEISNP